MELVNHLNDRLLFAVPKKGRLNAPCLDLLSGSDIQFHRHNRLDIALVKNLPIALIFLPAADIPTFVGEGRCELGITGQDVIAEHEAQYPPTETTGVDEIMDLGFGSCKLQVQVPEKGDVQKVEDLVGRNICTSFTALTEQYFRKLEAQAGKQEVNGAVKQNGSGAGANGNVKIAVQGEAKEEVKEEIKQEVQEEVMEQVKEQIQEQIQEQVKDVQKLRTNIKYVGGSVEAACALGVADGIVDLVESGETMRACGLHAIDTVVTSTAVLIKSRKAATNPAHQGLINLITARIRGVITAQRYVLCSYNVKRSNLDAACKITPGKRAPTITSLEEADWVAIEAMVERKSVATVMDALADVGAEDILVLKIENSRTNDANFTKKVEKV